MPMLGMRILDFRCQQLTGRARLLLSEDRLGDAASDAPGAKDSTPTLREDRRYWYELVVEESDGEVVVLADGLVVRSRPNSPLQGIIDTRSQAGLLPIRVRFSRGSYSETIVRTIEILPEKFDLEEFRLMVDEIAMRCLDLALKFNTPTRISLRSFDGSDPAGLQQRFFFLRYLLGTNSFESALARIAQSPHRRVDVEVSEGRLHTGRRPGRMAAKTLASARNRVPIPSGHPLEHLGSLPQSGTLLQRADSLDTAENRFVKFVLEQFSETLQHIRRICESHQLPSMAPIGEEAGVLEEKLRQVLQQSMFRDVGASSVLPFGSPVLQRRIGYRELLQAWLRYHVAATLHWDGAEDAFGAGKKDTDRLYEYWLFFQFLDVLQRRFGVPYPSPDQFLRASEDGLFFRLKAGQSFDHEGTIDVAGRLVKMRFSYNRTFSGDARPQMRGSWSFAMRPDFTITLWPAALDERTAEARFLSVHLHFDSKYRLEAPLETFAVLDEDFLMLKKEEKKGRYKRADLMIAHAYRDSIRRSGGSYILYPGREEGPMVRNSYHEILPGIGAFPIRPAQDLRHTGIEWVGDLLEKILAHMGDESSARARLAQATWQIYRPVGCEDSILAFDSIFLRRPDTCFTVEWLWKRSVLPLRVSSEVGIVSSISDALQADSVFLPPSSSEDQLYLVPVDRTRIEFVDSSQLAVDGASKTPRGIYALLPLELTAGRRVRVRPPHTLETLREWASARGVACLPGRLLESFVEILLDSESA